MPPWGEASCLPPWGSGNCMAKKFSPPLPHFDSFLRYSSQRHRRFSFYTFPRAMSVLKRDGRFVEAAEPYVEETESLEHGKTYFQGGREYIVDDETAAALQADGFTVEEID